MSGKILSKTGEKMSLKGLLNKDEVGKLWSEWKREEFGKSPCGFDLEKIEGASLFANFLREKMKMVKK